jgi:hypothetical protein
MGIKRLRDVWFDVHVCVCVCVISTSSQGGLPSDAVSTARQIHPPRTCNVIPPSDTPSASPWGDVS